MKILWSILNLIGIVIAAFLQIWCWKILFVPDRLFPLSVTLVIIGLSGVLLSYCLYLFTNRYNSLYFWSFLSLSIAMPFYGALRISL